MATTTKKRAYAQGTKSQLVRNAIAADPTATPAKIGEALLAKGHKVSGALINKIKYTTGRKAKNGHPAALSEAEELLLADITEGVRLLRKFRAAGVSVN